MLKGGIEIRPLARGPQRGRPRLSSVICRCQISDPMSGFFLPRRDFFMDTAHRVSGIGFKILVDLLASARRPPKIAEIPYTLEAACMAKASSTYW